MIRKDCLLTFLKIYLFICSIASGVLIAIVWRRYELTLSRISTLHTPINSAALSRSAFEHRLDNRLAQNSDYSGWLRTQGFKSVPHSNEELSYGKTRWTKDTEAKFLSNRTRVLCMVLSRSKSRSRALRDTWTRHCNDAIFYGKFSDKKIPIVHVDYIDASLFSTRTFCKAFVHLLKHKKQFDWLLIATDKTYAVVENLRFLVAPLNQTEPYYIGRPVHHFFLGVFNSHDSGIVLSSGAVQLLEKTGHFRDVKSCRTMDFNSSSSDGPIVSSAQFDSFIGLQLAQFGCKPINSYDLSRGDGGSRFHPFMPERHLNPDLISVFDSYWSSNVLPIKSGFKCCSDRAITFTGFSSVTMYFIEYVLYHLAAFPEWVHYKGTGNQQPSRQFYQVQSELDSSKHPTEQSKIEPGDIVIEGSGGDSWFPNHSPKWQERGPRSKPKKVKKNKIMTVETY